MWGCWRWCVVEGFFFAGRAERTLLLLLLGACCAQWWLKVSYTHTFTQLCLCAGNNTPKYTTVNSNDSTKLRYRYTSGCLAQARGNKKSQLELPRKNHITHSLWCWALSCSVLCC